MSYFLIIACFLLVLGSIAFTIMKPVAVAVVPLEDYKKWQKLWLMLTTACVISPMYVIFVILAVIILKLNIPKKRDDMIVIYFFLICALPQLENQLRGIAGISNLFEISFPRILTFLILLPLYNLRDIRPEGMNKTGSSTIDKLVILYVVMCALLSFRLTTFTNGLRQSFYFITDILIPYYAISRTLTSVDTIHKSLFALLTSLFLSAFIGIFEALKWWHIYQAMPYGHELVHVENKYEGRGGVLRANSVFSGPIVFGYAMMVALGIAGYFKNYVNNIKRSKIVFYILLIALYCSVSRGAWVATVVVLLVFLWVMPKGKLKIIKLSFTGLALLPFLALTPFWKTFVNLLPFIGNTRADTVDYRANLFNQALLVIQKNPWFGSPNFIEDPYLEVMVQGEGIVDLVNIFLALILEFGIIGTAPLILIFSIIIFNIIKTIKKIDSSNDKTKNQGIAILSIIIGSVVLVTTMSNIDFVPTFYWSFIAIGVAWLRIARFNMQKKIS